MGRELAVICAGGCLGGELLLPPTSGGLGASTSVERGAGASASATPRPSGSRRSTARRGDGSSSEAAGAFDAIAREGTQLLWISSAALRRLPPALLHTLASAARERHAHHHSLYQLLCARASAAAAAFPVVPPSSLGTTAHAAPAALPRRAQPKLAPLQSAMATPAALTGQPIRMDPSNETVPPPRTAATNSTPSRGPYSAGAAPLSSSSRAGASSAAMGADGTAVVVESGARAEHRHSGLSRGSSALCSVSFTPDSPPGQQHASSAGAGLLRGGRRLACFSSAADVGAEEGLAHAPRLAALRSQSFDRITTPAKVLVYGRAAAEDAGVAQSMAMQHKAQRQAMAAVLSRRRPVSSPRSTSPSPTHVKAEPKLRLLSSAPLAAVVDESRVVPADQQVAVLREEARGATLAAAKTAFTPPSGSASTFVQLKRMHLERQFSKDKFKVTPSFCRPDPGASLAKPSVLPGQVVQGRGAATSSSAQWYAF